MRTRRALIRWIRAKLSRRLDELTARLQGSVQDERSLLEEKEIDHTDLNVQQQLAGQLDALSEAEHIEIAGIRGALARMGQGTYGHCFECGDLLSDARIVAYPTAKLCVGCAELNEDSSRRRGSRGGALTPKPSLETALPDLSSDDPEEIEEAMDAIVVKAS